jgi:hypothetical protein
MKKVNSYVTCAMGLLLVGCNTTTTLPSIDSTKSTPQANTSEKSQSLSTEFRREGVMIYYKSSGQVDRVVAKGYAPVWQQQYEQVAELEAKEKLVKFLRGESVSSSRKTTVIAKSLERARDANSNKSTTSDGTIATVAEDLEGDTASNSKQEQNSTAVSQARNTAINNAQTVTSTLTVTAIGRLNAVRKINGEIIENGKTYVGTYLWTPVDQDGAKSIIRMMDSK